MPAIEKSLEKSSILDLRFRLAFGACLDGGQPNIPSACRLQNCMTPESYIAGSRKSKRRIYTINELKETPPRH